MSEPAADDRELFAERAQLERALRSLARMRVDAAGLGAAGVDAAASQGLARMRAARLESLGSGADGPPFFGRIDRESPDSHRVEVFHLGRRHIRDDAGDPVVIDWRAPIARHFYQATTRDPRGVRLRRRFGFHDGVLSSFEDEHLQLGDGFGLDLGLDSDLLRAEIERPRVGPMRDIVATIQPDQDELVRAELDSSLCIQGAPGTGKTAVGLHRAAYLLYSYPERLRRSGVLVVGPNSAFLRYIAQVLPALGENGIQQTTVDELTAHAPVRAVEDDRLATLKGDARLADVLRAAAGLLIGRPTADLVVLIGAKRYRIPRERLRRYVDDARRQQGRWSALRERLRYQLAADIRRQREDAGGAPSEAETNRIARSAAVRAFVDEVWPALSPAAVLVRLYTEPDFLRASAAGLLSEDEQRALRWTTSPRSVRTAAWTAADLVLLDELQAIAEPVPTYLHVVVDEAQDLSAMQCRAVGRRCPLGSVTVLGDLAQATTAWAPGSWPATLAHLGHPEAEIQPLTAGYRVPMPILRLANRLLPHIAPELAPASSVRAAPDSLTVSSAPVAETVTALLRRPGSVGVIVPDPAAEPVLEQLRVAGIAAESLASAGEHRVEVVPASAAKGLEYDLVVLVEPAAIVATATHRLAGLRLLYVCLTRAVSQLAILHTDPLPPELSPLR